MTINEWRPLFIKHLEVVITVSEKFDCHFQGVTHSRWAMARADAQEESLYILVTSIRWSYFRILEFS